MNVALATAAGGEDDLTHDKLSDLRTVGSGFGALIYNLPKDAGYEVLAERCGSLWEALQNSPDLPSKLVRLTPCNLLAVTLIPFFIEVLPLWHYLLYNNNWGHAPVAGIIYNKVYNNNCQRNRWQRKS